MRSGNQHQDRFLELLKPELARLQGFCQKLSGDPDHGDDLVQDALYDAWKGFGRLREPTAFRAWLYKVVINRYRTRLRQCRKQSETTVPLESDVVDETQAHLRMVRDRLHIAMAGLSARDRALVTLHELEGWSYSELVAVFGRSEGALRTQLTRCRDRMREQLRRYLDGKDKGTLKTGAANTCVVGKYERE